ncbi:MAG: response regulator [Bermanella sp.]
MRNILLVEDNVQLNALLTTKLERCGYAVRHAANGKEALTMYEQLEPDLIITDIIMPEVDGVEFLSRVKEQHPGAKFRTLAMSGGGQLSGATYLKWMAAFGADSLIEKPFNLADFITRVEALIECD